jgi:EAL domain-containing protein (putative c-di-GMP-specific phosphodiesterase class I)
VLKIDRSFMAGVLDDEERVRLVRGIVEMARSLHLGIVTEGIEETEQAALMHELRSDFGQGFLFSRPVAPDEIAGFIANGLPKESHA